MWEETLKKAKILIVDDMEENTFMLGLILQEAGYVNIKSVNDSRRALPLYTEFQPDLMILDLMMPYLDGFEIMKQLTGRISEDVYFPILILTADVTMKTRQKALSMGAKDFLTKPFDSVEALLRIKNLLETRFLHLQLQNQNQILEEKVRKRTIELEAAQVEIIERLALAGEYRDDNTGEHTRRVGRLAALIARAMGLPEAQSDLIGLAATLHDIGKIGIPDNVLFKPDRLTTEEFKVIKSHITIGSKILSGSRSTLLQMAEEIALTHHEHWDGNGYLGLREEEIPLAGRIVAIADAFDALTQDRPYKKAWTEKEAIAEIKQKSGLHFDPRVVEAFLEVVEDGERVNHQEEMQGLIHSPTI
jgi:putative two-component system response regulator